MPFWAYIAHKGMRTRRAFTVWLVKRSSKDGIDRTLARISVAQADGYGILIRRRKGPGDGWFRAAELAGERAPATLLAAVRGMAEPPPDHIRAEWMLESIARALSDLGGSFMVSSKRLPDLSPENVLLGAEGGLVLATGVASPRMTVLTDDPAAGDDGITTVAEWTELADLFRAGFIELVGPVVKWLDGLGLRPEKTLWRSAADRLVPSLMWSGSAFGDPTFARDLAARVTGGDPRLQIPLETEEDEYGGEYHLRSTCCLAYRVPGSNYCQGCPLNR